MLCLKCTVSSMVAAAALYWPAGVADTGRETNINANAFVGLSRYFQCTV